MFGIRQELQHVTYAAEAVNGYVQRTVVPPSIFVYPLLPKSMRMMVICVYLTTHADSITTIAIVVLTGYHHYRVTMTTATTDNYYYRFRL